MLTEKDYCDYDISITLGELGFPLKRMKVKNFIDGQFSDSIVTVLLYEAQKWLREEKEVYVTVIPEYNEFNPVRGVKYRLEVAHWKDDEFGYETIEWLDEECPHTIITFDSYEEALSEGVRTSIKILQDEQKENN
jgi:hypothetical protein